VTQAEEGAGKDARGGTDELAGDPRLRWYPRSWRARYGNELTALLDEEYGGNLPRKVRRSLVAGGLQQRARQSGLVGDSVPAADRIRAGALVVLAAWTAFMIAGASFSKFSEHFDEALPHGSGAHRVPDLAFTLVQTVAGIAGLLVVAGALLSLPAFVRFLRTGGWTSVRGRFVRALTCTVLASGGLLALSLWGHHLTAQQRNSGLHWYGVLFLLWAALVVVTLTLWTVAAVAAARRVELSGAILAAEAVLAAALTAAMVVMVGATAVWWAAMAQHAPGFLSASPGGAPGSPWDLWFVATVVLMLVAVGAAALGVAREVRVWTAMRSD
jgi:hypothetical protein